MKAKKIKINEENVGTRIDALIPMLETDISRRHRCCVSKSGNV